MPFRFLTGSAIVLALCLFISQVYAGSMTLLGVGKTSAAAPSFSGPGDVVSGAFAWWGLRAYSLAKAGTKAANICNSGDANCADVNTLANGNFDVATAQGAPLNCGGTGGTCTIKTLYDQSGNTNCTTACDITNATAANRPTLAFNCVGSLPCATNVTGKILSSASFSVANPGQPFTFSWIAERTASTTSFSGTFLGCNNFTGFANSANNADMFAGSHVTATANDNVIHAVQSTYNDTSSVMYVDGSSTNVSPGNSGLACFRVGSDTFGDDLNGIYFEGGFWTSQFNATQAGNMNTNQHSYWGF